MDMVGCGESDIVTIQADHRQAQFNLGAASSNSPRDTDLFATRYFPALRP